MAIAIHSRDVGGIVVVDLVGHSSISDGTISQQTVRGLRNEGRRFFILNLPAVRYLDSFRLGQIVRTDQNGRGQKGEVKIIHPNSMVKDVLRHTPIDTVVKVLSSEAEAVLELPKLASS